ncbi:peptidoglycan editing factor PgeF [Methylomarinum vadi]|uniref:peptidoglycan editing factor PgeF n=1 Tax=Methylomarinum vadi TaxID=438855 RepID=UPI0004DF6000|nr:peptidoglycan editing factor PgeF [Methylomarinum vadi]
MNWIEADWPAPAHVHAVTTLRTGGVSEGGYASLNPAAHVGDRQEDVFENRNRIKHDLRLPAEPVWLRQVHGSRVIKADRVNGVEEADASYSDRAGIVCVVLTADCLPLVFTNAAGSIIATAHAGWRGLAAGVIERTIEAMGSRDLLVWLGPAIGPERFEVGSEVRRVFLNKSPDFAVAFKESRGEKWLADIYQLARITLRQQGVERIFGGNYCTVMEAERFYSYRRDGETGRMATLIWRD